MTAKTKLLEEFNENPRDANKKELWKAVKNLKGKFTPKYIQMKCRNGQLVSLKQRSEAIADYLEKEHWNNPEKADNPRNMSEEKLREDPENIEQQRLILSLGELIEAIRKTKRGKEPGRTK